MLNGKKIVLGITGSIAAYKACMIIRQLVRKGAEVQVVITPADHSHHALGIDTQAGNQRVLLAKRRHVELTRGAGTVG